MYNTTTEPTEYTVKAASFFSALGFGICLIFPFFNGIMSELARFRREDREGEDHSVSHDLSPFLGQTDLLQCGVGSFALGEFNAFPSRPLTANDFDLLQNKIVREVRENGDIIMSYHKETETFWYYSDNLKEISYDTLESVARKFVIEHDCKSLFIASAIEAGASEAVQSAGAGAGAGAGSSTEAGAGSSTEAGAVQSANGAEVKSVFAKFKKYNTGGKGGKPNFSAEIKVTEQVNHFRYKGKLYDYNESLKERKSEENNSTLDYATYKQLMLKIKTLE